MKNALAILRCQRGSIPFWESFALKVVSFLLALILWVTFLGLKREEMHKRVKLEPLLAPGIMITNSPPRSAATAFPVASRTNLNVIIPVSVQRMKKKMRSAV